ncbi:MAG: TolC family protein [Alphaproteobacteria bacterium]|nr:TolC family protein [Alphaproteobacteria bacterium]
MFTKNKIFVLSLLAILFAFSKQSYAQTCNPKNGYDVLACAIQQNPDILKQKAQEPVYLEYQKQTKRWFAPELDGGLNYTKSDDEKGIEAELALLQNIEMPSKRKARQNKAAAEFDSIRLATLEQEEQTTFETLFLLNRLRQVEKEKEVVLEAVETFEKVLKKYRQSAVLSPEDEVSKDVFLMALKGYKIELQQLTDEKNAYQSALAYMLQLKNTTKITSAWFLSAPKTWPVIKNIDVTTSYEVEQENLNLSQAQADYLESKSSNANFNVGPYIATKPGGLGKLETYGIKFSFPFPVNANKNQIKGAKFAVKAAEQSYAFKKIEAEKNLALFIQQYEQGKKNLKEIHPGDLKSRHQNVERLFANGRVSTSLFIEAHQQMIEATKTYHQYEMETLKSLWRIYLIDKSLSTNIKEVAYAK